MLNAKCLTAFFSRTNRVGWFHKKKPFWIFLKQRWWDGNGMRSEGPYASHLHRTPERQLCQHLITHFLRARRSFCHPTNSIIALKACWTQNVIIGKLANASSPGNDQYTPASVSVCTHLLYGIHLPNYKATGELCVRTTYSLHYCQKKLLHVHMCERVYCIKQ